MALKSSLSRIEEDLGVAKMSNKRCGVKAKKIGER